VFLNPIRQKKLVNAKDLSILFSNVEQLPAVSMVDNPQSRVMFFFFCFFVCF